MLKYVNEVNIPGYLEACFCLLFLLYLHQFTFYLMPIKYSSIKIIENL